MAFQVNLFTLLVIIIGTFSSLAGCTLHLELKRLEVKAMTTESMGGGSAPVRSRRGCYVAEYRIGDPPQVARGVVDAGSSLVWTQSADCVPHCFPQDLQPYDASHSRMARPVPCNSSLCGDEHIGQAMCPRHGTSYCNIGAWNGPMAGVQVWHVAGDLHVDMFTFGLEKVTIAFGLIRETRLMSPDIFAGSSGVIGLGRGRSSLVSQLGHTSFSYCLTSIFTDDGADNVNATSHLFIGSSSGLGDGPIISMPFAKNPTQKPYDTFYYLPLIGLSVGDVRLDIPSAAFKVRLTSSGTTTGGTIIDSSFNFMMLIDEAYTALTQELARQLGSSLLPPQQDEYCVDRWDMGVLPPLLLHFRGGGGESLVLPLPGTSYWAPLFGEDRACMLIFSSAWAPQPPFPLNESTVIGSYMQQNLHVNYDLSRGEISFQEADCSSI